ncbi:hypothetical protein RB195_012164 [Necator americanus]|uniref:Uncharacterized protein n=1 Tax=Necator americanus TaxID=51031 RepID=A0ABR1D5U0_NECAM
MNERTNDMSMDYNNDPNNSGLGVCSESRQLSLLENAELRHRADSVDDASPKALSPSGDEHEDGAHAVGN